MKNRINSLLAACGLFVVFFGSTAVVSAQAAKQQLFQLRRQIGANGMSETWNVIGQQTMVYVLFQDQIVMFL